MKKFIKLKVLSLIFIVSCVFTVPNFLAYADANTGKLSDKTKLDVTINLMARSGNNYLNAHDYLSSNTRMRGVSTADKGFKITAGRYGHGVGMSQRGAQQMARAPHNKKYDEILAFYFEGTRLQTIKDVRPNLTDPNIRVLISTGNRSSIPVVVKGDYIISENPELPLEPGRYTLSVSEDGEVHIKGGEIDETIGSSLTFEYEGEADDRSNHITIEGTVHGNINYLKNTVFTVNGNNLRAVNHISLEEYLYGVVPYEMSNSFPLEALKAQAVAARGFAVNKIRTSGTHDIVDTETDQVYKGFVPGYLRSMNAVDGTKGEILTHNGNIVQAYYSASNGGQTELAGNVWITNLPYLVQKDDPYDLENPDSIYHEYYVPKKVEGSAHDSVTLPGDFAVRLVKTNSNINIRSGPSTSHSVLGTASINTVFEWVSTANGWHRIKYNGRDAYISADFAIRAESGRYLYANPVLADLQVQAFQALKAAGHDVEKTSDVKISNVNNLVNGDKRYPTTESRVYVTANANVTVQYWTKNVDEDPKEPAKPAPADPSISSTKHKINNDNITGLSAELKVSTFLGNISVKEGKVELVSASGQAKKSGDNVSTGDVLKVIAQDNKTFKEYPIIIYGDITGSGQITILDLLRLQRYLLGTVELTGPFKTAADVTQNGNVDILDLLRLQRHLLGTINISQ